MIPDRPKHLRALVQGEWMWLAFKTDQERNDFTNAVNFASEISYKVHDQNGDVYHVRPSAVGAYKAMTW